MLSKVIKFVSNLFESEESRKQKREEESNLKANLQYKVFKEVLNSSLPFIKVSESKNIRKEKRQVSVSIPNQQKDELKNIQGVDVEPLLENLLRNELTSTIQTEYIEKMFAIGWETHFKIGTETGKIFNISLDPDDIKKKPKEKTKKLEEKWKKLSEKVANFNKPSEIVVNEEEKEPIKFISYKGYSKKSLESYPDGMLSMERPKFQEGETNYENLATVQKRLLNNILDAIKELQNKNLPTREKKYRLFCNMQLATTLQDTIVNIKQQTGHPYSIGTILNESVEIWIDPYMTATDTRICVGYSDNKLIMAAEEKLHTTFIHGSDGAKSILSLTYGIDYLGDFSDCITFDVYLGSLPTI